MAYLYYNNRYHGLMRDEITKETACHYLVGSRKISKKHMCYGERWDKVYYKIETPELIKQYEKEQEGKRIASEFRSLSDTIQKCNSVEKMRRSIDFLKTAVSIIEE